jgi:hypothetical protein
MTILNRRRFTALLLSATPAAAWAQSPKTDAAGSRLDIRIGDDFKAVEADVRAVLMSAGESIWKHCPHTRWEVPGFFVFHSAESPITVYDHRADGRIAIGLTTLGTYWAQFAFQFSHEFCHALAGHSNDWRKLWIKGRKANHWLEESLCETASLFALRAMAASWKTAPPYPNWKSYANALENYAAERLAKSAAIVPAGMEFRDWLRENEASMREKSTLREKNGVIATHLLPVFEAEPAGWEAVTFSNLTRRDPEKTLAAHFADWSAIAALPQRAFIAKLAAVFGITA